MQIAVRMITAEDRPWVRALMTQRWGSDLAAYSWACYVPSELDGLVAENDGERIGALTLVLDGTACEVVTLDAMPTGQGAGTALIRSAARVAAKEGRQSLRVATTNDNLDALRFFQRRGFRIVDLLRGGADAARLIKPQIPLAGAHGIEMHDELVLERAI